MPVIPLINNCKIPLWDLDGNVTLCSGGPGPQAGFVEQGCAHQERGTAESCGISPRGAKSGQISITPHHGDSFSSVSQHVVPHIEHTGSFLWSVIK